MFLSKMMLLLDQHLESDIVLLRSSVTVREVGAEQQQRSNSSYKSSDKSREAADEMKETLRGVRGDAERSERRH